MESYRKGYRMNAGVRRRQRGITMLGFLILAVLFGTIGLAGIKITPMYIKNMRLSRVLQDTQQELNGKGANPAVIRQEIAKRFSIEDINLPTDSIKIAQNKTNGYTVRIQYENRVPYIADVWLLIVFDKQVEIRR
jgi:hypothetical protein